MDGPECSNFIIPATTQTALLCKIANLLHLIAYMYVPAQTTLQYVKYGIQGYIHRLAHSLTHTVTRACSRWFVH